MPSCQITLNQIKIAPSSNQSKFTLVRVTCVSHTRGNIFPLPTQLDIRGHIPSVGRLIIWRLLKTTVTLKILPTKAIRAEAGDSHKSWEFPIPLCTSTAEQESRRHRPASMQTATIPTSETGEVLRNSNTAIINHCNARQITCIRKQGAQLRADNHCDVVN